ncbi:hypothetical protein Ocin01_11104 [Orchesella cincta]|uniref:SRCR domain-containing protein n=1 Tax=Orchesella cincta TaxID=48709 RepID=A0A1D2MR50_ORCCI|nr:hypothetical protein Ocin01_11104 [Orchesella cincta]
MTSMIEFSITHSQLQKRLTQKRNSSHDTRLLAGSNQSSVASSTTQGNMQELVQSPYHASDLTVLAPVTCLFSCELELHTKFSVRGTMGCCTYFSKTWRPGYGTEFIDPNKAFNFERRLRIIKRVVIALLILAVLVALVYLLVSLASGSNENCPHNTTTNAPDIMTTAEAIIHENENSSNIKPIPEAFNQASIILPLPLNTPTTEYESSEKVEDGNEHESKSEEEEFLQAILETNGSSLIQEDLSKIMNESEVALVNFEKALGHVAINTTLEELDHKGHEEEPVLQNDTTTITSVMTGEIHLNESHYAAHVQQPNSTDASHKNHTSQRSNSQETYSDINDATPAGHAKLHNATNEMWCSYTHNVLECVALSKNFKKVTTFLTNRTYDGKVEGYVLVKVNNTWHPYCRQETWNLKMGYSLCKGFGFKNLDRLNTIDITELKQRITSLGTNVSLQPGNRPKKADLLVLEGNKTEPVESKTKRGPAVRATDTSEFSCKVGFVSCNNL